MSNAGQSLFQRHLLHILHQKVVVQAGRPFRSRGVASHIGKLLFEFIDARVGMGRRGLDKVSIEDIPLVPLQPSSRFQHAKQILQQWGRVVLFHHAHKVSDVNHVVLLDQIVGRWTEYISETECDVLGKPFSGWQLAKGDVDGVEPSGRRQLLG